MLSILNFEVVLSSPTWDKHRVKCKFLLNHFTYLSFIVLVTDISVHEGKVNFFCLRTSFGFYHLKLRVHLLDESRQIIACLANQSYFLFIFAPLIFVFSFSLSLLLELFLLLGVMQRLYIFSKSSGSLGSLALLLHQLIESAFWIKL